MVDMSWTRSRPDQQTGIVEESSSSSMVSLKTVKGGFCFAEGAAQKMGRLLSRRGPARTEGVRREPGAQG